MVTELNSGQMVPSILVITKKAKSMVKAISVGLMNQLMMVHLLITTFMDMESTYGLTEGALMDLGKITKWKEMVFSAGKMVESTKVSTKMTKKKDMELSSGPMAEGMMVIG